MFANSSFDRGYTGRPSTSRARPYPSRDSIKGSLRFCLVRWFLIKVQHSFSERAEHDPFSIGRPIRATIHALFEVKRRGQSRDRGQSAKCLCFRQQFLRMLRYDHPGARLRSPGCRISICSVPGILRISRPRSINPSPVGVPLTMPRPVGNRAAVEMLKAAISAPNARTSDRRFDEYFRGLPISQHQPDSSSLRSRRWASSAPRRANKT
jgi:hypothetical protein